MRWKEGFWSNVLSALAVFFSALVAVGWWESAAVLLCQQVPWAIFLADSIALWTIFLVTLAVLNELTRLLSRVKVKFIVPVEKAGNALALLALFLGLYGFFLFSMDLSPVGENPDATVADDSPQLQVLRLLTAGNLSSFTQPTQFDRNGEFRQYHLQRRKAITENRKNKEDSLFYEGQIPPRRQ
jgi:hypothetical protein